MKPALDEIITRAGKEAFEEACRVAWRTAPGTGKSDGDRGIDLAHDLYNWILYDMPLAATERVALLFAVYERMPCYSLLLVAPTWSWSEDSTPEALALCQAKYREFLGSDEDALADPIAYSIWCGPFEGVGEEVESWWRALAAEGGPPRLYERLLEHSGPVPWELKEELYERLLPDERWHPHIFRSLHASRNDVYGQIDSAKAWALFQRLRLPPDTEFLWGTD
jgi:hypothetical protein